MNSITPPLSSVFARYSAGEISASQAIDMLGGDATVHDVIAGLHEAGLPLPRPPRAVELAQIERARRLIGQGRDA